MCEARVTYAYARDGCFPLSRYWCRVNKVTKTPVNAVWFNVAIGELLLFLIFAGEVSIGALFSVGAIGAFIAFTIPIALRVFLVGNRFRPGPWTLGIFSRPVGYATCAFVVLMLPILCFPGGPNPTAVEMNWTCVVYGGPMIFAITWYIVDAHKWFKGPKVHILRSFIANCLVNVEHRIMGDGATVIEGKVSITTESGSIIQDVKV
jgi:amino acid transporter